MGKEYWSGEHTKHKLRYQIVWIPKYQKRILENLLAIGLKELLKQTCEVNRWMVEELNIHKDHVHLLIQVWADKPVSIVVQILKGGTSKKLREEFSEIEEYLWGDSFWADGYFAETVGIADEKMIRRYIREQ
jgi:putative transposase